ncbi:hypothetical protein ACRRTK_005194 [Alexandromys fortis]
MLVISTLFTLEAYHCISHTQDTLLERQYFLGYRHDFESCNFINAKPITITLPKLWKVCLVFKGSHEKKSSTNHQECRFKNNHM